MHVTTETLTEESKEKIFQLTKDSVALRACCGACLAALRADVGAMSSRTDKGSRRTHSTDFGQRCFCATTTALGEQGHCNFQFQKVACHFIRRVHNRLQSPSQKGNSSYAVAIWIFDHGKSKNLLSSSESYPKPLQSHTPLVVCSALMADGKSTEIKSTANSSWEH